MSSIVNGIRAIFVAGFITFGWWVGNKIAGVEIASYGALFFAAWGGAFCGLCSSTPELFSPANRQVSRRPF